MATGPKVLYEFGPFRVDPDKQVLLRENQPVAVTPKAFEILLILLRHSREVVPKDALMNALWPDAFVEEANLSQNVFMLRKALGETPEDRRYIITHPGKGYSFAEAVRTVTEGGEDLLIASRTRSQVLVEQTDIAPSETLRSLRESWLRKLSWKYLLAAGAGTLLVLGSVFYLRKHQPVRLGEEESLLIADFANTTGDPVFDGTLRQGLSVQLEQSTFLNLISDERIQNTLRLMDKPNDARLTPEIAREICERTGSTAVVNGSIASLGSQYVLGLRAINCHSGDVLDQQQVQVARKEDVLKALDQIANRFRTHVGESLSAVQKHNTPLETTTTSSLEALKAYSTATQVAFSVGFPGALPHLKRAVEIDPQFAMAYAFMGLFYNNSGESVLSVENTKKAYQLRDRATDRERFFITTLYERNVTGNLEKEQQILRSWGQTYPRDRDAHGLLAGFALEGSGQYEKAIEEANIALGIEPDFSPGFINIAYSNFFLERIEEAEKTIRTAAERKREAPELLLLQYYIAFVKSDAAGMDGAAELAKGKPGIEDWMLHSQALVEARSGRLQASTTMSHRAVDMARQAGQKESAASYEAAEAVWEAMFGSTPAARRSASEALKLSNGRDVEYGTAFALAVAGDLQRAQSLAADLQKRFPEDTSVQFNYLPALGALFALSRHEPAKAIEVLQANVPYELAVPAIDFNEFFGGLYPVYVRGQAYLAAHQGLEAAEQFQKILQHRGLVAGDPIGALARLQLGRAYAMAGDNAKAKSFYRDFLSLWKDADPDIPILKQATAEYLKVQEALARLPPLVPRE